VGGLKNGIIDIGGGGGSNLIREYDGPASRTPFAAHPNRSAADEKPPRPGDDPIIHVRAERQGAGGGGIKNKPFPFSTKTDQKASSGNPGPTTYNTYKPEAKRPADKKAPLGKDSIRIREEDEAGGGGEIKLGNVVIGGGGGMVHIRDLEGKA